MRSPLGGTAALAILIVAGGVSYAAAPAGYETIYDAPTRVNLGGRPVVAGIALSTDRAAAKKGDLKLVLTTDVTDFITDTERDLEKWVAAHQDRCGQRWGAGKPYIGFPKGAIRFALDIELEVWNCGWNGKDDPSLLTIEAGKVDVTLVPSAIEGKLQASLGEFSISNRSGVSKFLPLEFVVRGVLEQEIKKLNQNPKFYKAPKPITDEGFVYESIFGRKNDKGRVIITARYRATGDEAALKRVADRVRAEGIRSEGVKE